VCVRGYDYGLFCFRTFYSRVLFAILPAKLNRLKEERKELHGALNKMIEFYYEKVDVEYANNRVIKKEDIVVDISKDDLGFLEKRYQNRRLSKELETEIDSVVK
jgi:hypothetical protein